MCNLPDNRLEFLSLTNGLPVPAGSVMVGLDPVSVRFRTEQEAWVVNRISETVSVVDLAARNVVATIDVPGGPADLVFAGSPPRAFVSCGSSRFVRVIDPITRTQTANIEIDGEQPRAMGVSPDGSRVYMAMFESGNASTILAPAFGPLAVSPTPGVVEFPGTPYGGLDPPPNSGNTFVPRINTNLPTNSVPPRTGLIVKRDDQRRWMDDNGGDWTAYVHGTNAVFTGRSVDWDLADHDLAIIDTAALDVAYVSGLMNICMDLSVNPASGQVAVVGTDALNSVRYEPVLRGVFARVKVALVNPQALTTEVADLNPHLDYKTTFEPESVRFQSLGDPRGIVWNQQGTRAYVTGMGSSNLVVLGPTGQRLEPKSGVPLGAGASGLAIDEPRRRLYVLNRFDATVSTVDTDTMTVVATIKLFDPTPEAIRAGRPFLYDTHRTSGLGQASCGSCHVDARSDRLAWDLGNPAGEMVSAAPANRNYGAFPPAKVEDYHPMKGPMVTQSLQDIIGHEPFHWRGDRDGLEQFNQTFTNLQGAASALTTDEMRQLKSFLATITLPPNRLRQFDNSLSTNVSLTDLRALGRGTLPAGAQLPAGNAAAGLLQFRDGATANCSPCHTFPTGLGVDMRFAGARFQNLPLGTNGEHHVALISVQRSLDLPFKIPQLRTLPDKLGADFSSASSRAGFGFFHDGRVDSLVRFLQDGFGFTDDQQTADLIAFLLSFSGSDLPAGTNSDKNHPPGAPSQDVPASVGRQITIQNSADVALIDSMIKLALSSTGRVDLVVKGAKDGLPRGWFYNRSTRLFQSDRQTETISPTALRQLAAPTNALTYTVVPQGSGIRIGIDRDEDGFLDQDEADLGSNPADPRSVPPISGLGITLNLQAATIRWDGYPGRVYRVQFKDTLSALQWNDLAGDIPTSSTTASKTDPNVPFHAARFYRVELIK